MLVEKLTTIYSQHTIFIQRLGATEGLKVTSYLELIEDDVVSILNKYRKRKITQALQADIQEQISAVTRKHLQAYTSQLKVENRALGAYEAEFAATTLNSVVISEDFNATVPSAAAVNSVATAAPVKIGVNSYSAYSSMMKNYWGKWADEIDGVVLDGFRTGQTIPEVTSAILEQMDLSKSGTTKSILDRARRSAKQLAIIGSNHYANTARIAFVDHNDDILKGYRFLAVNDSRTSRTCARLDQTTYLKDDPKLSSVTPPLHPGCRSALTYEVDDRFKLDAKDTKKASSFEVDGKRDPKPIDSDSIYYANLKKLGERDEGWKDIDAAIGPSLGKALRKMDAKEFAKQTGDSMNRPLTIKQMKSKNNTLGNILNGQNTTSKTTVKVAKKVKSPVKSISKIEKASEIKAPVGSVKINQSTGGAVPKSITAKATLNKKLTGDESAYIEYYKGDGFYKSNDILRNPSKYSSSEFDSAVNMRKSIDSAINKSTLDSDAFVFRGIRDKDLFSNFNADSIGAELSIDTAQSVAKDAKIALNYSGAMKIGDDYISANKEAVVFKIKAKAGQKALDMEKLTGIGDTAESELLLSSLGKYKVTGIQDRFAPNGDLSLKIIEVDYVD